MTAPSSPERRQQPTSDGTACSARTWTIQSLDSSTVRPLHPSRGPCIASIRTAPATGAAAGTVRVLRILVADADPMVALLISEMLEDMGHDAHPVTANQADLLSAAIRRRPDLLIIEERLSKGTGFASLMRYAASGSAAIIVLGETHEVAAWPCPTTVMLDKPFCFAGLARAVHAAITMVVEPRCHAPVGSRITRASCLDITGVASA